MKSEKQLKGGNRKMEKTNLAFAILAIVLLTFSTIGMVSSKENSLDLNEAVKLSENSGGTSSSGGGYNSSSSGATTSYGEIKEYIRVSINPEKQQSDDGRAKYKVILSDLHKIGQPPCVNDPVMPCFWKPQSFKYKLYFSSSDKNLLGEFEQSEVNLNAGESITISLDVQAENKGTNLFEVSAVGDEGKDSARGLLIYGNGDYIITNASVQYFNGKGFALNEDESMGHLVKLHLIKNGKNEVLDGKMFIGGKNFRVSGSVMQDGEIRLSLSRDSDKALYGSLKGKVDNFKTFSVLRGTLDYRGSMFKVTLIEEKESDFKVIEPSATVAQQVETKVGEITVIKEGQTGSIEEAKQEIIIRPTKVKNEKILWVFPTGNKILEAEVTKEGRTYTENFKENSETEIQGYTVKVGGLENADKIPIEVNKGA